MECRESNTKRRNLVGTNGREFPVEMSQMRVVLDPGRGTAVRVREEGDRDFHSWSSESAC